MKFIQTCLCSCQQLPVPHLAQTCSKLPTMPSSGCPGVASPSPVFPGFLIQLHLASALFTYLPAVLFHWPVRINFPEFTGCPTPSGSLGSPFRAAGKNLRLPARPLRVRQARPTQQASPPRRGAERSDMIIPFQKHIAWKATGSLPICRKAGFSQKIFTATQILELTLNLGVQKRC